MEHHTPNSRIAQLAARLQQGTKGAQPVLPQGVPRGARLEPFGHVQHVPLAQSLATFGLQWQQCLDISRSLHAGQTITVELPAVEDGPLATVILASMGVRLILDR
jgi:hypothetical protein